MGKGLFRLIVVFWLLASVRLPAADSASADTCAAAQSAVWRFAVIGDTQGSGPDQPVSPVLDLIIAKINELKPDFAVQLGDKVCGTTDPAALKEQFAAYRSKTAKLTVPLYEVAGNHDVPAAAVFQVYQAAIAPEFYYSFDHQGCHFVVLSSEQKTGLNGGLGREQLDWLADDLKNHAKAARIFAFIHRPLYRGVVHPYILGDSEELERLLFRYKVGFLFAGHEHRFGIARRNSLTEYLSGGGGAPLLNFSEESGGYYHFLMVSVKTGGVEVDPVKIDYPKTYQDFGNLWKTYFRLRSKPASADAGRLRQNNIPAGQ